MTDTLSYLVEMLVDFGYFMFDLAIAFAQMLLDLVGLAGVPPEALLGIVLVIAMLRVLV